MDKLASSRIQVISAARSWAPAVKAACSLHDLQIKFAERLGIPVTSQRHALEALPSAREMFLSILGVHAPLMVFLVCVLQVDVRPWRARVLSTSPATSKVLGTLPTLAHHTTMTATIWCAITQAALQTMHVARASSRMGSRCLCLMERLAGSKPTRREPGEVCATWAAASSRTPLLRCRTAAMVESISESSATADQATTHAASVRLAS